MAICLTSSYEGRRKTTGRRFREKSIVPLDCALGIDALPFKITPNLMLEIAYYAADQLSYEKAEEYLFRHLGIKVNDDTIRSVTNYIGRIIFEEDCRIAEEAMKQLDCGKLVYPHDKKGILYIETDGAAVNTRIKDANGSSWRENKLGLVFSSDHVRYWNNQKGERVHKILRREYISFLGSAEEFKKHLFAVAVRNGLGRYQTVVLISDGAAWIRNMKEELFPEAQQILDLYHALENISDFSKAIFSNEEEAHKWARKIGDMLKDGKKEDIFKELKKYENVSLPAGVVNIYTYLKNNEHNIDYPQYKKLGYFVGDGAIESGNKTVMQARMKQAGMRWSPVTAQYILSLRAKIQSGLWDSYVVPFILRHFENLSI